MPELAPVIDPASDAPMLGAPVLGILRAAFLYFTTPTPGDARRTKGGKWP